MYLELHVHSGIIYNGGKVQAAQGTTDRQNGYVHTVDEQNGYIHTVGILSSLKKEGISDTCYNMDEK